MTDDELIYLLTPLFWDKSLTSADFEDYPMWIICRALMYGNLFQAGALRPTSGIVS